MKTITVREYKINLCIDIIEWGKAFYGIPDNIEPENRTELESECMGFAEPTTKTIWIFLPEILDKTDLSLTIAHEIGHLMKTPSKSPEKKAEHYENFYQVVTEIIELIILK